MKRQQPLRWEHVIFLLISVAVIFAPTEARYSLKLLTVRQDFLLIS